MNRIALLLALLCCSLTTLHAETRDPLSTIALQLDASRKTVGDFTLRDSKGELFAVGRILVAFSSIYEILANPEATAKGECEVITVPVKNGKNGLHGVHQMRYWFNFEKSTIHLNTDLAGEAITLTFDFDPSKDFADGEIRKGLGHEGQQVGTCSIRIRDSKN